MASHTDASALSKIVHLQSNTRCTVSAAASDLIAKLDYFISFMFYRFFILHRTQTQATAACNFHMSIEMLNAFYDPAAFSHARSSSQGNRESLLSFTNRCMGLMGIAPRCAAVNKRLKLPGKIRPIRWRYGDNHVCPLVLGNDLVNIILLNTFGCMMTGFAAFTKNELVIIDAYTPDLISCFQTIGDNCCNFCSRTIFHGTAIYNQSFHFFTSQFL